MKTTVVVMQKSDSKTNRRGFFGRTFLTLGAVAAGSYADARYIEPGWLDVTYHTVFLPELPLAMDGFTVTHLSDLHCGTVTPDSVIRDAVALALREKPHLAVLTGDFVNRDPDDAERLAPIIAPLAKTPLGMVGVLGNHDYKGGGDAVAKPLEAVGLTMLRNRSVMLAPGLHVAGIEDTMRGAPDAAAALRDVPDGAACLFLSHNPVGVWNVVKRSCVTLSGHTHGGQICVPGFAPRRPGGMEGFPMLTGWGTFDKAQLFITRGVGMMHEPYRFLCRPEVAVITVKRGDGEAVTHGNLLKRARNKTERVGIALFRRFA